jgi:DNA repair photolyase
MCRKYGNPAGIITKNQLILRDIDILEDLAKNNLIFVNITITTLKEDIRRQLEPRTSSCGNRLKTIEKLAAKGIPVGVMIGPIIPGLTDAEIPDIINAAADYGAKTANYTMVRLNGALDKIFKTYPAKAERVLNNIRATHQGQLNDNRWSLRMRGDGELANSIHQLFYLMRDKYMPNRKPFVYNTKKFKRPGQLTLNFDLTD